MESGKVRERKRKLANNNYKIGEKIRNEEIITVKQNQNTQSFKGVKL